MLLGIELLGIGLGRWWMYVWASGTMVSVSGIGMCF